METSLDRLYLEPSDGSGQLTCKFNPTRITVAKTSVWSRTPARGHRRPSAPEYVGNHPRTLTMELFFDGWDNGSGDISRDVEKLFGWMVPTQQSQDNNRPQPPTVVAHWGQKTYFQVYVKSVNAVYELFDAHGAPLRGTATVTFEEIPDDLPAQNPTSGGIAGRRTHLMTDGDTLQSVAFKEYGKPTMWRALAEANGIDDPRRVPSGTRVLIPASVDATRLAAGEAAT